MNQAFINADGTSPNWPDWVTRDENGHVATTPDEYGAIQLIVATAALRAAVGDPDALARATETYARLLERPTLPLLNGILLFSLSFAQGLYGEHRDELLSQAALAYALKDTLPAEDQP